MRGECGTRDGGVHAWGAPLDARSASGHDTFLPPGDAEKLMATGEASSEGAGKIKVASTEHVAALLESARRVVIVPGYGMALAHASHAVHELTRVLESRGIEVEFAVHPVAGRMPGHMNVLLDAADIASHKIKAMDEINPTFPATDVAVVIGANDIVNPLAGSRG